MCAKQALIGLIATVALSGVVRAADEMVAPSADKDRPRIQVAILLDNSGSMEGLINQAKAQLWKFINEFATARKNGRAPLIEVALYTYGNPPPKQIVPLTDDLDLVSEKLFAVQISGGTEYCGQVIQMATNDLKWSAARDELKVIFIAGNEPFTQGPVNYAEACKAAIAKGIVVNTIHCGSDAEGVSGKWKDGALLADGMYMCINQNQVAPVINAPQDKEIADLGAKLNATYVAYGAAGRDGQARQQQQDTNAAGLTHEAAVQRYVAKAQTQYRNSAWDLVDAINENRVKLEEVKDDDLPEPMRKMSLDERRAYVNQQNDQRLALQKRINELNQARQQYVAEAMKKQAGQGDQGLDAAMIGALRQQAAERHYVVDGPTTRPAGAAKS
jgi:Mg-chelatase subunit ChlD